MTIAFSDSSSSVPGLTLSSSPKNMVTIWIQSSKTRLRTLSTSPTSIKNCCPYFLNVYCIYFFTCLKACSMLWSRVLGKIPLPCAVQGSQDFSTNLQYTNKIHDALPRIFDRFLSACCWRGNLYMKVSAC